MPTAIERYRADPTDTCALMARLVQLQEANDIIVLISLLKDYMARTSQRADIPLFAILSLAQAYSNLGEAKLAVEVLRLYLEDECYISARMIAEDYGSEEECRLVLQLPFMYEFHAIHGLDAPTAYAKRLLADEPGYIENFVLLYGMVDHIFRAYHDVQDLMEHDTFFQRVVQDVAVIHNIVSSKVSASLSLKVEPTDCSLLRHKIHNLRKYLTVLIPLLNSPRFASLSIIIKCVLCFTELSTAYRHVLEENLVEPIFGQTDPSRIRAELEQLQTKSHMLMQKATQMYTRITTQVKERRTLSIASSRPSTSLAARDSPNQRGQGGGSSIENEPGSLAPASTQQNTPASIYGATRCISARPSVVETTDLSENTPRSSFGEFRLTPRSSAAYSSRKSFLERTAHEVEQIRTVYNEQKPSAEAALTYWLTQTLQTKITFPVLLNIATVLKTTQFRAVTSYDEAVYYLVMLVDDFQEHLDTVSTFEDFLSLVFEIVRVFVSVSDYIVKKYNLVSYIIYSYAIRVADVYCDIERKVRLNFAMESQYTSYIETLHLAFNEMTAVLRSERLKEQFSIDVAYANGDLFFVDVVDGNIAHSLSLAGEYSVTSLAQLGARRMALIELVLSVDLFNATLYADAIVWLERAVGHCDTLEDAWLLLSRTYLNLGDKEKSIAAALRSYRLNPSNPMAQKYCECPTDELMVHAEFYVDS